MNIYIYGSDSFKKEVYKVLKKVNIEGKGQIEEIPSVDILKETIKANPDDIYLIDDTKIIKNNSLSNKFSFLKPKDAIEQSFLDEHGIGGDLKLESFDELAGYIQSKFEDIDIEDVNEKIKQIDREEDKKEKIISSVEEDIDILYEDDDKDIEDLYGDEKLEDVEEDIPKKIDFDDPLGNIDLDDPLDNDSLPIDEPLDDNDIQDPLDNDDILDEELKQEIENADDNIDNLLDMEIDDKPIEELDELNEEDEHIPENLDDLLDIDINENIEDEDNNDDNDNIDDDMLNNLIDNDVDNETNEDLNNLEIDNLIEEENNNNNEDNDIEAEDNIDDIDNNNIDENIDENTLDNNIEEKNEIPEQTEQTEQSNKDNTQNNISFDAPELDSISEDMMLAALEGKDINIDTENNSTNLKQEVTISANEIDKLAQILKDIAPNKEVELVIKVKG